MDTLRRTKIVATLGPASNTEPVFRNLVRAGLDVVRLNFSHGTHEEHGARLSRLRQASDEKKKSVAALQDLCGPKIRTGSFPSKFDLPTGVNATLVEGEQSSDERVIRSTMKDSPATSGWPTASCSTTAASFCA